MSVPSKSTPLPVVTFTAANSVSAKDVDDAIKSIWKEIQTVPSTREAVANELGTASDALIGAAPPFHARIAGSQFGVAETIIIFMAAEIGKDLIARGTDVLWDRVFKDRINALFGGKLKTKPK
jgi:hypothetical protein